MKAFWMNIIETSGARIYSHLIGVIFLFLTAHFLGPEGRGTLATVSAWVGLFAVLSGLSLGQVAQYHIQEQRQQDWLPRTFGTLIFFNIFLAALGCFSAYVLFQASEGQFFRNISTPVLILGFLMLPFIIGEEYGSFLLSAAGSLRPYNLSQIIGRTFGIFAIALLALWGKLDVIGALVSLTGGQIILCVILFWSLKKIAAPVLSLDRGVIKTFLKSAAKLHLNTVAAFLLAQVNILMLNYYATPAEVGWYQLSLQMIMIMLVVPQAASLVLYSQMAEIGPNMLWPKQKQLGLQVLAVMVLLSVIAYFFAPLVIPLMAGPSFGPSIKIFQFLLPALLGMTIASLLANQWIGRGIFLTTTITTLITAAANIAINFYTIPKYGMMGAVWSMVISFAFLSVIIQLCFAFFCENSYRKILARPEHE